ncbi:hypothetical protein AB0N28_09745 [Streptomyces sp. NPDC051130]|uniref:hypothetical protein n=1 Tax=Streptomyces sp. NPDC051130 TaxID=3157223 RepID=UPI00343CFE4C
MGSLDMKASVVVEPAAAKDSASAHSAPTAAPRGRRSAASRACSASGISTSWARAQSRTRPQARKSAMPDRAMRQYRIWWLVRG